MSVQVGFVYNDWLALFPEFEAVTEPQATAYFNVVTTGLLDNSGVGGPVTNQQQQTTILYWATAFVAAQMVQAQGSPSPGSPQDPNTPVGRLDSATEGSISVHFDMPAQPAQAAFWLQNKYGAFVWQMLRVFMTARYKVAPRRIFDPFPGIGILGGNGNGGNRY